MFNLSSLPDVFEWTINMILPNNGKHKKTPIKIKFYRLPHDEYVSLLEQAENSKNEDYDSINERKFFDKIFAGWVDGEIKDEDGDVEVNEENKSRMLDITEFRQALVKGFFEATGGDAVKPKN